MLPDVRWGQGWSSGAASPCRKADTKPSRRLLSVKLTRGQRFKCWYSFCKKEDAKNTEDQQKEQDNVESKGQVEIICRAGGTRCHHAFIGWVWHSDDQGCTLATNRFANECVTTTTSQHPSLSRRHAPW